MSNEQTQRPANLLDNAGDSGFFGSRGDMLVINDGEREIEIKSRKQLINLVEAARKFSDKVDSLCETDEFKSVFDISRIHGCPYQGETWEKEAEKLKAALKPFQNAG